MALSTVELNWSSVPPALARPEGTNPLTALPAFEPPLLARVVADDPVFVALAFMALRFLPREVRLLLPPLVACGMYVWRVSIGYFRLL